jgi:hypothetical protein
VSITQSDAGVEQILAAAPRVQNVLPAGSTWDGKSDLPMDEATFQQMLTEKEPDKSATPDAGAGEGASPPAAGSDTAGTAAAPAPVRAPTPPGAAQAQPVAPKNGG